MRIELFDFQKEAVEGLTRRLRQAVAEVRGSGEAQALSLTAPTGSGKTVMTTALIENVLAGDEHQSADPDASFLWVSDQPELNEQTRRKMLATSSVLGPSTLVTVDGTFDEKAFPPGVVCFLNIQKLGRDKSLVTHGDRRTYTVWETVANTVRERPDRFYVIIDEAHRGMTETPTARREAATIVQRFIKGDDVVPPVPIVLGISATPARFAALIEGTGRTTRPLEIAADHVRSSGLLKDTITLHRPRDARRGDMTLLAAAAAEWSRFTDVWADYCEAQHEPLVEPILVVQVEDRSASSVTRTDLPTALDVILNETGHLADEAWAHCFQEAGPVDVAGRTIRYLAPSDITEDPDVRVVFFKTALNTGWDCPRAEVMMSFRKTEDATLIAQLVGRMVRTPLARRIEADESLNTVALFLPYYDREGLDRVVAALTEKDSELVPPVAVTPGSELATAARAEGSDRAFNALEHIPSYLPPARRPTSEIRRLMKLARLLAHDEIEEGLDAAKATVLDGIDAALRVLSRKADFKRLIASTESVAVERSEWRYGTSGTAEGAAYVVEVREENLDELFDDAGRRVGEGLHKTWWRRRVSRLRNVEDGERRAKLELVALIEHDGSVLDDLEDTARRLIGEWFDKYRDDIRALPENRRSRYDEVRAAASRPERHTLTFPRRIEVPKRGTKWDRHLYITDEGTFPTRLNAWERAVLDAELSDEDVVGWLRNIARRPWALAVPYDRHGTPAVFYPDFLVLRRRGRRLQVDILDPHGLNQEDAPSKAAGLARYADQHALDFGRIQAIIVDRGAIRRLELTDDSVRHRVLGVSTREHLEQLFSDA